MYIEENYKRSRKTFAQVRHKDKATKFGNSIPQTEVVAYVWEIEGDGKDNIRTWKCVSVVEGSSWTSLVWTHYQDRKVFMAKTTKL